MSASGEDAAKGPSTSVGRQARDAAQAEWELRLAWLRVHSERMYAVDPSGELSAYLCAFANLIEIGLERRRLR